MPSRTLLTQIWGADYADDTPLLRTRIANPRREIEDHATRPRYILTEPGVGYRCRD